MARPVRPWFRVYVEMFPDRKIRRLRPAQRWVWVAIMGAARESPEPGRLYVAPGLPMSMDELADYAGVTRREAHAAVSAMAAMSMVTCDNGLIAVTNWDSRQFESDDTTARTRAHRERSSPPPMERSKERSNPVHRNAPERTRAFATETETETETERRAKYSPASADAERPSETGQPDLLTSTPTTSPSRQQPGHDASEPSASGTASSPTGHDPRASSPRRVDDDFAEWWQHWPRKRDRGHALKAYRTARRKADAQTLLAAVQAQAPALMGWGAEFCPYPATWLNGERWHDQPDPASRTPAAPMTSRAQADAAMRERQLARAAAREQQTGAHP